MPDREAKRLRAQAAAVHREAKRVRAQAAPATAAEALERANAAIEECDCYSFLPHGIAEDDQKATARIRSFDNIVVITGNAVIIEYHFGENRLYIQNFFNDTPAETKMRLRAKVPARTLAGKAMEWIKHLGLALGVDRVTLVDVWEGQRDGQPSISSEDLSRDESHDLRQAIAKKHAWPGMESDLAARLKSGYYNMFGVIPNESRWSDGYPSAKPSEMFVVRSAFTDTCI